MIILRLLVILVLTPFVLLARLFGFGRRNIVTLPDDHPAMARAIQQARETLPQFRRLLASPAAGMDNFGVKVRFPVDAGRHEHCWVNDLELRESGIVGKLGNEPNALKDLKLGSQVTVSEDAITDWSYSHNGVYQGHYTTRALLPHLPAGMRRQVEAVYGWSPA